MCEVINKNFGDIIIGELAIFGEEFGQFRRNEFETLNLLLTQGTLGVVVGVKTLFGKHAELAEELGQFNGRIREEDLKVLVVLGEVHFRDRLKGLGNAYSTKSL